MTSKEAAAYLRISRDQLRRLGRAGRGPAYVNVCVGSLRERPRYRREDLDRWVEEQARR